MKAMGLLMNLMQKHSCTETQGDVDDVQNLDLPSSNARTKRGRDMPTSRTLRDAKGFLKEDTQNSMYPTYICARAPDPSLTDRKAVQHLLFSKIAEQDFTILTETAEQDLTIIDGNR
ncbi:hypothetical protein CHS0354_024955 [Potamilus streckersoni]|uniref:Uncharacterized protein n=1 Tax=Potamilus streckersoni TaxID=2493646 RepID=A0AAE0RQ96_9BIVA|nr:hypothetical protein CHS0354_024955 [Potamilus streckersoni]